MRNIDFEEFMHPVRKEEIIEQYPLIEKTVNQRIISKREEIEAEKDEFLFCSFGATGLADL